MDDDWWGILFLVIYYVAIVLLFLGALRAQQGEAFWATRLIKTGATLFLVGSVVVGISTISIMISNSFGGFMSIGFLFYFVILIGLLLYIIGFCGFCARWGATGKRRMELLEITSALSAARDQAQRDFEEQNSTPNPQD